MAHMAPVAIESLRQLDLLGWGDGSACVRSSRACSASTVRSSAFRERLRARRDAGHQGRLPWRNPSREGNRPPEEFHRYLVSAVGKGSVGP
jgi:hypothetical protein